MRYFLFAFSLLLFIACQPEQKSNQTAQLLITNANVFAYDSVLLEGYHVLVDDGQITQISKDIPAVQAQRIIEANGAFLMPGLNEGHGHFMSLANAIDEVDLSVFDTWSAAVQAVKSKAEQDTGAAVIIGRNWHQEKMDFDKLDLIDGYPTAKSLSEITKDRPVFLKHASGHAALVNAYAMQIAGITKETPDPYGGVIVRNKDGSPTGMFLENAVDLIAPDKLSKAETTKAQIIQRIKNTFAYCHSYGITSFQDAATSAEEIQLYRGMAEQEELKLRLYLMAYGSIDELKKQRNKLFFEADYDHFLSCRAVKTYLDGALGSRGAWLLKPYTDAPDESGQSNTSLEDMRSWMNFCKKEKLQLCTHAIGDKANRVCLDLIEETEVPKEARWRIEHAQHIDPTDQKRFAQLGIIASMQPIHCTSDAPYVNQRLGPDRARATSYVWQTLVQLDAKLAIGTDVPVEPLDPFANMYAALTRKSAKGSVAFNPEQNLSRKEVLQLYTKGNAYAAFEEDVLGAIQVGYLADLILLDKNLLHCTDEEILQTKVLYTIVHGEVHYMADK